jgi:hypothetical protein
MACGACLAAYNPRAMLILKTCGIAKQADWLCCCALQFLRAADDKVDIQKATCAKTT